MDARVWLPNGHLLRNAALASPPPEVIHLPVHLGADVEPGTEKQVARFRMREGSEGADYDLENEPPDGWHWVDSGGQLYAHRRANQE